MSGGAIERMRPSKRAWKRALRPKRCHLAENPLLAQLVAQKLKMDWSPQQISGWLKREFGDDRSMRVSHETIYRSLFIQARGVLKKSSPRICGAAACCVGAGITANSRVRDEGRS